MTASRLAVTRRGLLLGSIAGISGLGIGAPSAVLPDVSGAFGVSDDATAWVLAAFVLGTGMAMALGGRALDVLGTHRVVAAGSVGVLVGTVVILTAPTFVLLVFGRFVQGAGTGWLCIAAFNAVSYVREGERARVGGVLTAVSFSCIAASALVGAVVAEAAGWRAACSVAVLTLVSVPALLRGLPREARLPGGLDLRGAALATTVSVSVATILQGPATGTSPSILACCAAVGAAAGVLLVRHLRREPHGFLPLEVLRNRELVELSFTAATIQAAYTGLIFAAPLILAEQAGWTPLQTGAALFPGAAVGAVSAHLAGTRGATRGVPSIFVAFCAVSAVGVLVAGLGSGVASLAVLGTLLTIGPYAGAQAVMLGRVSTLVDPRDTGAATGTFTYIFITGGAVGAAATGGLSSVVGLGGAVAALVVLPVAGLAVAARRRAREASPAVAGAAAAPARGA